MHKAIFLDRDGVINEDMHDYTWKQNDFRILEGVFEACGEFVNRGYLLIVITNQGGIAKGLYSHEDVNRLHHQMLTQFRNHGIEITEVYYCPHHEVTGLCLCRKPGSLLVEKAMARFDIDPSLSYFIGDRDRDILAATAVGVKGILVPLNDDLRKTIAKIP